MATTNREAGKDQTDDIDFYAVAKLAASVCAVEGIKHAEYPAAAALKGHTAAGHERDSHYIFVRVAYHNSKNSEVYDTDNSPFKLSLVGPDFFAYFTAHFSLKNPNHLRNKLHRAAIGSFDKGAFDTQPLKERSAELADLAARSLVVLAVGALHPAFVAFGAQYFEKLTPLGWEHGRHQQCVPAHRVSRGPHRLAGL